MKTKKPLISLIPDVLNHIEKHQNLIQYNQKMLDIFQGQLLPYIEKHLQMELSPESYSIAKNRIPPINIVQQLIQKKAGTYTEPASRSVLIENEQDKELLNDFIQDNNLDQELAFFEEFLALGKYCSLELYFDKDEEKDKVRTISNNLYLPFSDSVINPEEMTVYIKFMGEKDKLVVQEYSLEGVKLKIPETYMKKTNIYRLYSEDEYLEIDGDGDIIEHIIHNDGKIPFIHIHEGNKMIPVPDSDLYQLAIIIPSLMTDINYYIQFCTHSTMYGIDVELPPNVRKAPDAFWSIKSSDVEGATPSIGVISSNADTASIWETIQNLLTMWLETKGLKTSSQGKADGNNLSGIAKVIDESDASRVRKRMKQLLLKTEYKLWKLVSHLNHLDKQYSEDFKVIVEFAEEIPLMDFDKLLTQEQSLKNLGLTTKKMSLVRLFPERTEEEIDIMLETINLEINESIKKAQENFNNIDNKEDKKDGSEG